MKIENFEQYKAATENRQWMSIFALNGVDADTFGTNKELQALADHLENGEVVFALASGVMSQTETSNLFDFGANTWLAVLTDRRILCLDAAMLTGSIDTQTIRLDRVQAVSSSQGFMLGKISIDLGARVLVIDNCVKSTVSVFAKLANKLIEHREDAQAPSAAVSPAATPEADPIERLKELGSLRESGVLNEDEFQQMKKVLLAKLAA